METVDQDEADKRRALDDSVLAVLDMANIWETNPDEPGNRTALCVAVRKWRKAGDVWLATLGHRR